MILPLLFSTLPFVSAFALPWQKLSDAAGYDCHHQPFKHVVTFSVDGMHSSDVGKWMAMRPNGNISMLLQHAYEYTNAWTSAPSDSFPGTMAQYTGATPKTTGVWYDDVWDRSYYYPSSGCVGKPGAEVLYDETIDYNDTQVFSGGINPANLPQRKMNGKCQNVFPHMRPRVNTIFELVRAAGYETAYTDKHPAYDIVRGPSGTGLNVGYFPEIAAFTTDVADIITYDQLHVNAWLDWVDGMTPVNTTVYEPLTGVPTFFGGNFQSMSVAQKTIGYNNDSSNSFSDAITEAMTFVDASIGAVVDKMKANGLYEDTLIIVASKHGQAPINRSLYAAVDPTLVTNLTGVPVEWQTSDDIALIFLNNSADTATAAHNLQAGAAKARIQNVIWGQDLIDMGFGNPATDPAVPNIIVQPELGTIYTTDPPSQKIAEHGGLSTNDRVVACFASNPRLTSRKFSQKLYTTQVGPTVLRALGLPEGGLQGAAIEGTVPLPGFM